MSILTDCIREDGEYSHLLRGTENEFSVPRPLPLLVTGLCDGADDALYVSLLGDLKGKRGTALIVCADEKECLRLRGVLTAACLRVAVFNGRDFNFYNVSASHEYEHERLMVLYGLQTGRLDAVITTPDAALGFTIPPERLAKAVIKLSVGNQIDITALASALTAAGYSRMPLVENPGQFAVRGGIIDIYPPNGLFECPGEGAPDSGAKPLRVELFGDEVDRMGLFDVTDQRLTVNVTSAEITPAREVLTDSAMLGEILKSVRNQQKRVDDNHTGNELQGEIDALTAAIGGGGEVSFADKYISKIYPEKCCLLDYFGERPLVFICGTESTGERLRASMWHMDETVKELTTSGMLYGKYAEFTKESAELSRFYDNSVTIHFDSLARGLAGTKLAGMFNFRARHSVSYARNSKLLMDDISGLVRGGWRAVVSAGNETEAKNLCGLLCENGFAAHLMTGLGEFTPHNLPEGEILITTEPASRGYMLDIPKIAVLSTAEDERSSAAAARLRRRAKKKSGESILSYNELNVGDYVVHENYGIGQYEGIENLKVDGVSRDYINIKFAGSDRLFLPTEKLDMLSKYIGARSEDGFVKLSKFGGAEWGKAKNRAKTAVKEIAKDLIKLYAERQRRPGHSFPPDDDYQRDFEAAFEYRETDSQLTVTDEIKNDMMKHVPMDRLLCGDVGFGKTEVAFRAAFKAVLDGKQVAILVPTTILALQHYKTALTRMRAFGVTVDMVSRFRTPKQQKNTIRELKAGAVDIIIGTHRLLSKDVEFSDLGLLIVDEEQRFGVAQKEKIKQTAKNVDVLTLTATPIPRTLNMAMGGIRDISVLDEAPGDRLPVQTYVLENDDMIIFDAIRRELRRGGQVFYLHNIIENIDDLAAKLASAFPEARITTAHGRMEKEQLEDIWRGMLAGEIDILVCTSIIETGVDVPNANTLIVDNAHRLGLSQLHQIRGRVGRSSRRAYAYFTYPKGRALTEIAEKRLEALRDYAEFGAGFRIALRDLELRGAGNLLGAEQSGHLDAIGYELYIKLLHDAVLEEQGKPVKPRAECQITLGFDAFIPENYVPYQSQRMSLYKRIAAVETREDADDLTDELSDRYGEPPRPVLNLLEIALIHARAVACGVTQVRQAAGEVLIYQPQPDIGIWQELADSFKLRMVMSGEPHISLRLDSGTDVIATINALFEKYTEINPPPCRLLRHNKL